MIQQRIRHYGTRCHEARRTLEQARYEYAAIMTDRQELLNRRGEAFHYLVKLKQLSATRRQQKEEIVSNTELFVSRTTRGARVEKKKTLSNKSPETEAIRNRSEQTGYDRKDVTNMIKYQLTKIDTLLEEEKEACERAEAETRCKNKLEDEAFREMRDSCSELQEKVRW
ncbi:hypothetical protein GCK32_014535 [Trichostrongylus colubriformis]|uniref:Uncharacterized protein n=1 Tax=Trichostrongylus colubriformis TaxID=6319 RepID=A0AAN8FG80_TRICO